MWLPTAPCFLKGHAFKRFCGYPINYICCKRKKKPEIYYANFYDVT